MGFCVVGWFVGVFGGGGLIFCGVGGVIGVIIWEECVEEGVWGGNGMGVGGGWYGVDRIVGDCCDGWG